MRIPPWTDRGALQVGGTETAQHPEGDDLVFDSPNVDVLITIDLPLVEREIALPHRTRTIQERLRGDAIVAMDTFGADLTYFPPLKWRH